MICLEGIQNVHDMLAALELQSGDRCMIRYMVETEVVEVHAKQFFGDIRRRSLALCRLGLAESHIGIIGKNTYDWIVSFCAVLNLGAVAVLLSRDYRADEIAEAAERTDLNAILYDPELEDVICQTAMAERVLRLPMRMEGHEERAAVEEAPGGHRAGLEDLGCILFTSGTAGKSKAVMLSNRALMAGFCHDFLGRRFEAQLGVLPFHHVAGFNPAINALCLGAVLCIGEEFKDIYRYLECMKPDYLVAVPSLLSVIVRKLKKADAYGASLGWNLHMLSCGGAKFQPETVQVLEEHQITIVQGYGASELGGIGFHWEMTMDRPDTIGKVNPDIAAKIVEGELCLHSDSVMMGYYKEEAATREVLQDGWYLTGDLVRQDEEGYFYLVGRKKNLIILSNGENVSPEEIEGKLRACEDICEVMIGVEKDFIAGTVFPKYPPNCTDAEKHEIQERIREAVRQFNNNAPTYKQIQFLHFREEPFAKTALGKLIRRSVTGGMSE